MIRNSSLLSVVCVGMLLFAAVSGARGQWVQTNGPEGGGVLSLVQEAGTLYAGTDGGVFSSTDNGKTWKSLNSPPNVIAILVSNSKIFASCGDSVFVTTNSGSSWKAINHGLPANWEPAPLLGSDTNLFVCMAGNGIYRSTDGGLNWISVSSGLSSIFLDYLSISEGKLYAGNASTGTYVSSDWGNSWAHLDGGLGNATIHNIITVGTKLFASTLGGLYVSNDSGSNWQKSGSFLEVYALCTDSMLMYVSTGSGIYFSSDTGKSWQRRDASIAFNDLAISGAYVVASGDGVCRSSDSGISWEQTNSGLIATGFNAIVSDQKTLLAGNGDGVYISTDGGNSWASSDSGLNPAYKRVSCFLVDDHVIFLGAESIYSSTDGGLSWNIDSAGLPLCDIFCLAKDSEGTLWASTDHNGIVYNSTDNGNTWASVSAGLPPKVGISPTPLGSAIIADGTNILVGVKDFGGIYISSVPGSIWHQVEGSKTLFDDVNCFSASGSNLFAGLSGDGVLFSSNGGLSWINASRGLPPASGLSDGVNSIVSVGGKVFAGTSSGVYMSNDNGNSWQNASLGLSNIHISSLAVQGAFIYASTAGSGVWRRPLSDFGISSVSPQKPASTEALSIFPNPASGRATIDFTAPSAGYADVRVVNELGAEVARVFSGEVGAGEHSFVWEADKNACSNGMYECVVRMNGQVWERPVVFSR